MMAVLTPKSELAQSQWLNPYIEFNTHKKRIEAGKKLM